MTKEKLPTSGDNAEGSWLTNEAETAWGEAYKELEIYKTLTREVRSLTGIGETTTEMGIAELRAEFRKRHLIYEFINRFKNKQDLPEAIACDKRTYASGKESFIYFLPRTNEIYTISRTPHTLSEAEKDNRFIPENPQYVGQEIVNHLIRQNEGEGFTPLPGLHLEDAKPRFSSEEELYSHGDTWGHLDLSEKLTNSALDAILQNLKENIHDPDNKKTFEELERGLAEIEEKYKEEQEKNEKESVERLKAQLVIVVRAIEDKIGPLPEKISLEDNLKEEINLRKVMNDLGNKVRKLTGKAKESLPSEIEQIYLYPHTGKLEIVSIKQGGLRRKWEEDETTRREATSKEWLKQRTSIRLKLTTYTFKDIRLGY